MTTIRGIALLAWLAFALLPAGAAAQPDMEGWHPSVTEATLLPKYCWGQFMGSRFKGPEYTIPRDTCGVGMNHYCPGLVALGRANRSLDDKIKRGYLAGAKDQLRYTVGALRDYPRCPIRGDIMRTSELIDREIGMTR